MRKHAVLTTGPIGRTIVSLTAPMTVGMVGMVIFNLVDTFFIGRLGTEPLAAMGFTLSVVMIQGAISMGLGVGAAAVISRAIGQGDHGLVQRLTVDSLFLSVVLVLVFATLGLLTIDPLFSLLGARGHLLRLVRDYMSIWYLGVPFVVIPMVGNNAIRAAGNTMIPSIIMLVAVAVNIVLDPLLIFGIGPFPRMELKGAALATLCARATTMVASLLILRFRFDMLTARLPSQRQLLESWKNTLHIAAPAALTQVLIPLSLMAITRLVAFYGSAAVAAFGISMRLEMFVLSPLMALGAVLVPFVGQNAGAGRPDRIMGGMRFSYGFSLLIGAVIFIVMGLFGRQVAAIFNPDPVVIRIVYRYLLILSLSYGFQGSVLLTASYFNAMRRPANAMAITLLRTILLYVPLAWIGSHFLELVGVFTGAAFSSVLAGIAGILWVRREVRSEW